MLNSMHMAHVRIQSAFTWMANRMMEFMWQIMHTQTLSSNCKICSIIPFVEFFFSSCGRMCYFICFAFAASFSFRFNPKPADYHHAVSFSISDIKSLNLNCKRVLAFYLIFFFLLFLRKKRAIFVHVYGVNALSHSVRLLHAVVVCMSGLCTGTHI